MTSAGVRVALVELEPDLPSDISADERCFGIHTPVSYRQVDGGAGSGAGSGEAAIDIENIIGLSPGVTVDVYQGPDAADNDAYDVYKKIINATGSQQDQVISTSWGSCEANLTAGQLTAEQDLFAQAAAQGQTVIAAAGDSGSTGCYQADHGNDALAVQDPASQPNVLGVGGTAMTTSGDVTWNDSAIGKGAGGGGPSAAWCMPSYQDQPGIPGLIGTGSVPNPSCQSSTGTKYQRQVPDVSAASSLASGYLGYYLGHWSIFYGTSAAAPLWASVAALIDASPFCRVWQSGDAGARPPGLYFVAADFESYIYGAQPEGLTDVTAGDNDYATSGYTGGSYPATTGYDLATGLGTPLVSGIANGSGSTFYPGLAALMCLVYGHNVQSASVTGISPHYGPTSAGHKITVTGTGFVPIAGADVAEIGSARVPATCTSLTQCTVIVPTGSIGPVDVQIDAEDFGASPVTAADRYQRVAPPTISSLSPSSGASGGGTKVTIRGSGFFGTVTVRFGAGRGTGVRVASATKLVVTAPPGDGTVEVTVTAAGGTSAGRYFSY